MISRFVRAHVFVGLLALFAFHVAVAQAGDDSTLAAAQNRSEPILQAIAAGKKLDAAALERVPDLIVIVEKGDIEECELAIRALAGIGPKASPAIAAIIKKLPDPTHATRSAAADALAAIGDKSVVPVRKLLNSPNGSTRASAAQVLVRLKGLEFGDVPRMIKDPDTRVRTATSDALSRFGKPAVPLLVDLLQDPDLGVAFEAAHALQINRADASIAVPWLAKALSRTELVEAAADALSAYGMEASQAIPALIDAYPNGRLFWRNATEDALQHIGPPREADVPLLCESLARDEETRMVVAKSLGLLGVKGKSAAEALEAAAEKSAEEHVRQTRDPKLPHTRAFIAIEDCAIAVWDVTHDTPRFLRLLEKLAIAADSGIFDYFAHRSVLTELSPEDCRLLEKMLHHSNIHVQQTALAVLKDVGPNVEPLKKSVLELASGENAELSRQAVWTLAAIGAKAGTDAAPVLISKVNDGTIPLQHFADAIGHLEIRTAAARAILERGLHDKDRWTASSCATALCATSNEPRRTARLIIDAARVGSFSDRDAVESLRLMKAGDDVVIPFLVEQLQSDDYWTRHDAIVALGSLPEKATQATELLTKLLDDPSLLIRLKTANTLFLINHQATDLEKQLDNAFASDDPNNRSEAIKIIGGLSGTGGKFIRYVLMELRRSPPVFDEEAINALQAIGTKEAVVALRVMAESSDWKLRSQAVEALKQIENPDRRGGK
jgi:HEAT repeat protein